MPAELPTLVFPIGVALGADRAAAGEQPMHLIRVGAHAAHLPTELFTVWELAYGSLGAGSTLWDRTAYDTALLAAGVTDPDALVEALAEQGLLALVPLHYESLVEFAHQIVLCPTVVGLGNSPHRPDRYDIGLPGLVTATLSAMTYDVLIHSDAHPSMADALDVAVLAAADGLPDAQVPVVHAQVTFDVVGELAVLLASRSAYLDRATGR